MLYLLPELHSDLFTPLDVILDQHPIPRVTLTPQKGRSSSCEALRARSRVAPHDTNAIAGALGFINATLPPDIVVQPHDPSYKQAIFIGNLLHKSRTPAAFVFPRNVDDIVQIVNCAHRTGLHLSIKNGGHSHAGYCLNYGGIVMDMSSMKRVEVNEESTEITIEAGCLWKEVYAKLTGKDAANMIVGRQCPSVGVSGFVLGGGFSPFTRSYGMGIDNVIEMTVVTASGGVVTLTRHETNPAQRELFWALCGGGGGNFAVLVEFKARVHRLKDPLGTVCCGQFSWKFPQQEADFKAAMRTLNEMDCPNEMTIDAIWRHSEKQLLGEMTIIYNGGEEAFKKASKPLLRHKPSRNTVEPMPWSKWVAIEEGFDVKSHVYHHHVSFILGKSAVTAQVVDKIISLMNQTQELLGGHGKSHFLWGHMGGVLSQVQPSDTPFFWRDGVYACNFKIQWTQPCQTSKILEFMDEARSILSPHALQGKAAYLNYIDHTLKGWQEAYYGANYPRLQKVKSRWDPTNLFKFEQGVEPHSLLLDTRALEGTRVEGTEEVLAPDDSSIICCDHSSVTCASGPRAESLSCRLSSTIEKEEFGANHVAPPGEKMNDSRGVDEGVSSATRSWCFCC